MTRDRFLECLEALHWTTETLAEALECDESLTEAWALGLAEVPMKAGVWLNMLAQVHEAMEERKPKGLKGKRYSAGD